MFGFKIEYRQSRHVKIEDQLMDIFLLVVK